MSKSNKTTKEFKIPTMITNKNQMPVLDRTKLLFWDQPSGEAKATGTPITKKKDKAIKERTTN